MQYSQDLREVDHKRARYFIAGIDPGLHTAVVLVDLKGRIIAKMVERNAGEEKVISFISSMGTASLVATDVSPPPKFVLKVSSHLNVPIFYPQKSMKKSEKDELGKSIKDPHLRDAYAAAMKAFNYFSNTLRKIDHKPYKDKDHYKHSFLRGKRLYDLEQAGKGKRRFKKLK